MQTFLSFNAADLPPQDVRDVLADYLVLEQTRSRRRRIVTRFGLAAFIVFVLGSLVHGVSVYARGVPVVLCLVPAAWIWYREFRLQYLLSKRLDEAAARKS
jgi:hypothetical protein